MLLYKLQLLGLNEKLMLRVVSNIYDLFNLAFDGIFLAKDDDDTFDVVADHQQCNCKPKPPSADHLHSSAAHHISWPKQVVELDEDKIIHNAETETTDAPVDEDTKSDVSEPVKKRAKCNSTYHDAKPSQLHFYNGAWVDILECAKQHFQLWLITECPFAEHEVNFPDAQRALNKAIEESQAKDIKVEAGK